MKKLLFTLLLLSSVLFTSCTDATWDKTFALTKPHTIQMYSGGKLVRTWHSTGKVKTEESSDGYYFRDVETKQLIRVSGDVVISIRRLK